MKSGPMREISCVDFNGQQSRTGKDSKNTTRSASAFPPCTDVAHGCAVDPQSVDRKQRPRQEITIPKSDQGHDISRRAYTNRVV